VGERLKYFEDCLNPKGKSLFDYKHKLKLHIGELSFTRPSRYYNSNNNSYDMYTNEEDEEYGGMKADYMRYIREKKASILQSRQMHLKDFLQNTHLAYSTAANFLASGLPRGLNRPAIERSIVADAAPFLEGERAIQDIKTFFAGIQKQIKKSAAPPTMKESIFRDLKAIYDSQQPMENEGNTAIRRMDQMRQKFEEFGQRLRELEDRNKKEKAKQSKWGVGGRRSTLRRLRTKHRKTRKQ
jgi:hypothetical protein